ncbi:MAG TPA: zinc-ribbon domain-containing protein [Pyrinomonadaceae bacterium]|jgi:hypothetical protein|nr:zinc-ribbon domain-containing protein [Pyrinomonadaceae bacterium]
MFCPKCGIQNPETGKFCRSCGTDLGNVSDALTGKLQQRQILDKKGKPIHWEGAITKFFTGLAFLIVSLVLAFSNMGRGWWFWLLIPAFTSLGAGVAQYIQLRKAENGGLRFAQPEQQPSLQAPQQNASLPPSQTEYVSPDESIYKTGDLVPPSVTDSTTRHLEMDPEGKTMTLPKR